jgi:hypothetical protein
VSADQQAGAADAAQEPAQDENTVIIMISVPKGAAVQVRVVKPADDQSDGY